jgi:inosine/xanthosine triphosphatase
MESTYSVPHIIVAIGSTNPAKIEAVRWAVERVWPGAQLAPLEVDSGVGEMPRSDAEGKRGALQRARAAQTEADADYGMGLEGAVDQDGEWLYMVNWAAVVHRDGRYAFGCGGRMPLPDPIAREIRQGGELGPIIDRYTGQEHTKRAGGAAGFLTRGLVPRSMSFQVAVAMALAPFLRPELYRKEG